MNTVTDIRALRMVRQFHSKRVLRFLKGRQLREVESLDDLQRSKSYILELNNLIGDK